MSRGSPPPREPKKPRTRPRGDWCPVPDDFTRRRVESDRRRRIHCPGCGRYVLLAEEVDAGGELLGYLIPPHKTSRVK